MDVMEKNKFYHEQMLTIKKKWILEGRTRNFEDFLVPSGRSIYTYNFRNVENPLVCLSLEDFDDDYAWLQLCFVLVDEPVVVPKKRMSANDDFWLIEEEPVAERRVQVSPDESATDGTTLAQIAAENSLGLCRKCRQGTAYLLRFADGTTEVRCDRCCTGHGWYR